MEKLSESEAYEQSEKMRQKIETGQASNYAEAEEKLLHEAGVLKTQIAPVENLIPDIKPESEILENSIAQTGNKFDDSFITDAIRYDFRLMFINSIHPSFKADSIEVVDVLRERFKDKIVVDLGAGDTANGYFLANMLGAKGYVAVEPFHGEYLKRNLEGYDKDNFIHELNRILPGIDKEFSSGTNPNLPKFNNIPASVVQDTMLRFLKRLPPDSVCIFTFGIFHEIISDLKYVEAVNQEIKRTLSPDGLYVSDSMAAFNKGLSRIEQTLSTKDSALEYARDYLSMEGRNTKFFVKDQIKENVEK